MFVADLPDLEDGNNKRGGAKRRVSKVKLKGFQPTWIVEISARLR